MKCPICGFINEEKAVFCGHCGQKITAVQKTKKLLLPIILGVLVVIFLLVLFLLVIPQIGKQVPFFKPKTNRVIMIYMVGSDLESKGGAASADLEEMADANIDLTANQVVVYAGGAEAWSTPGLSSTNNSFLELKEEGFEVVMDDDLRNMADADTLTYFLNHVYQNYKGKEYDLILWNHGGGPIYGYGQDELHQNDLLNLKELATALKNSPFNNKNKLELIGFDACLMASVEIAKIASNYADYMVGSQETEPGAGWNYDYFAALNEDLTAEAMGQEIIDQYYDYFIYSNNAITLSLLDLSKITTLEQTINNLFSNLETKINTGDFNTIANLRFATKDFGRFSTSMELDLVDLLDMAELLTTEEKSNAQALVDQVNEVVIYQKSNIERAHGLSMYYPYAAGQEIVTDSLAIYNDINFAQKYRSYLTKFVTNLYAPTTTNWNISTKAPLAIANSKSDFSFQLTAEQNREYAQATYLVFRDMKDGYFMPMFKSTQVTKDDSGLLQASIQRKGLTAIDQDNDQAWLTMFEIERSATYTKYLVPVLVYNLYDESGNPLPGSQKNFHSYYLQVLVDEAHPTGQLLDLVALNQDAYIAPKELSKLKDWQYIQFLNYEYIISDENGNYNANWESSGTAYYNEMKVADLKELAFADLEAEYDYYCLFMIKDIRGNRYYSNMIKLQK